MISPSISNSVTAGVNYFHQTFSDANTNFSSVAQAGFVTGAPFPNAPNIQIGKILNRPAIRLRKAARTLPGSSTRRSTSSRASISCAWAANSVSAQVDEFYHRHAIGNYQFLGGQGPNGDGSMAWNTDDQDVASLADFLAGYLTKGSIAVGNPERTVFSSGIPLFAQDSFQVTTNLNFNFGLRYDYMQPMHDSKKDLSVFRPGLTTTGIAFQGQDISSIYDPTTPASARVWASATS